MSIPRQNRLKSPIAWASLAALFSFISKTYFKTELNNIDELLNLFFTVLIAFGILNNPTNENGF